MQLLFGSTAVAVGAFGLILTLLLRRLIRDPQYRDEVSAALWPYSVFLLLRVAGVWLASGVAEPWHRYLRTAWMLAFAFGTIHLVVATALWVRRLMVKGPAAKIHRDVLDFVLYVIVTIPILKTQLQLDITTLLGTSAVLSLVLGFALQDTLSNLFSGLSLQFERPFQVGDFIQVREHVGRVVQVAWRSTRIQTTKHDVITLPNALSAKEAVINYSRGGQPVAIDITFGASYRTPPNTVKEEALRSVLEIPAVLKTPAPWVRVHEFQESAILYIARVFIADYGDVTLARDEVLSRLWYRFGRRDIEIPFPQRVVTMRQSTEPASTVDASFLESLDVFGLFSADERSALMQAATERRFGAGESVLVEGSEGDTFFVIVKGTLSVRAEKATREIAKLGPKQAFGEMSLLTGEPRFATVIALTDCVLLEFDRASFAKHFTQKPERAAQLADLLAQRKAQLELGTGGSNEHKHRESSRILERLRSIFGMR